MPSVDRRLTKLEDALIKHLTESGEIREAIRTLHKSIDSVADRVWGALVFSVVTLIGMVGFLLKVSLWK